MALTNPDGLLAGGGDLRPERLVRAYRRGIFPWFDDDQPILWWSPNPRSVIRPEYVHISKSMAKALRKTTYRVTCDTAFTQVVSQCAAPRAKTDATWITGDMLDAYRQLHERGIAHSVEVWDQESLIGGLYGLALGRVFFGESMFAKQSNASKIGFITLAQHLASWGFRLIDCQVSSDHLNSLGAYEMPRAEFAEQLRQFIEPGEASCWPDKIGELVIAQGQTKHDISSTVNKTTTHGTPTD